MIYIRYRVPLPFLFFASFVTCVVSPGAHSLLFRQVMEAPSAEFPGLQIVWLLVLAIPIACVAWTVTHEEVFREPREYCIQRSQGDPKMWQRKLFYLFTCEYCFSHYVTAIFLFFTGYRLLLDDWRGYVLSFFALVWVANVYMSLFSRLRVDITSERAHAKEKEKVVEKLQAEIDDSKQSSAPATRDQN